MTDREWRWASREELATAWGAEQPLLNAKGLPDTPAHDCLADLVNDGDPESLAVIAVLIEHASSDQDVCDIGAGPLENLLSHAGHGLRFVDQVEGLARGSAKLRSALECLWLGEDVDPGVRARLVALGASDLVADRDASRPSKRPKRPSKRQDKRPRHP